MNPHIKRKLRARLRGIIPPAVTRFVLQLGTFSLLLAWFMSAAVFGLLMLGLGMLLIPLLFPLTIAGAVLCGRLTGIIVGDRHA